MRIKDFIYEAIPLIILGVLIVNLFEIIGIMTFLNNTIGVAISKTLGLPKEVSPVILFGFLRKDICIGLLAPYNLTAIQLVISSIFLTLYFPCISTFFVMIKELKFKNAIKMILFLFSTALTVSYVSHIIIKNLL